MFRANCVSRLADPLGERLISHSVTGPGSIRINCFRSQTRSDFVSPALIIFEASFDWPLSAFPG